MRTTCVRLLLTTQLNPRPNPQARRFQVKSLELGNCYLTEVGMDLSGVQALCAAVATNATLEYLGLAANHLLPPVGTVQAAYVVHACRLCCAHSPMNGPNSPFPTPTPTSRATC
jgi:hypothetical protein